MFNLGFSELLLLGAIALIFIGPKQLPDVARTVGRFLNELKRASSDFQDSLTQPLKDDVQNRIAEHRQSLEEAPAPEPQGEEEHKLTPPGGNHAPEEPVTTEEKKHES